MNSDFVETRNRETEVIFAGKTCSMIEIEKGDYAAIAENLFNAIGDDAYFNGSIEYECESFYSTLTATLIIYRGEEAYPEGSRETLSNVVPVWWEFNASLPDGTLTDNDFGFDELKKYLLELGR